MTKRSRPRRPLSAAARSRGRYALMVIGVTMASVTGLLLAAWWFGRQGQPAPEDHPHVPGAHGGALVSVGEGDLHYHAEAVVGKQGFLSIYTYGDDAATVREIESQLVTARVRVRGESDAIAIDLLPIPQPGDGLGKTSRFGGKLPRALRGFPVEVIVPEIAIDGKPFRLEFPPPAVQNSDREPTGDEPERLPLTPGGKYTAADVTANSNVTVAEKYPSFRAAHEFKPRTGDRVCPVTRARADPAFAWTVAGQVYLFCCPPCVEEFLRTARDHPDEIKDAGNYVQP